MALVRLWMFTARPVGNPTLNPSNKAYAEGGTYDTSVLNSETGNCSDARQWERFQDMMEYANSHGESLQKVNTAEEAYALCSAQKVIAPKPTGTTTTTSGDVAGCLSGICGPTNQPSPAGTGSGGGTTGGGTPQQNLPIGSPSPGSGQLPGMGYNPSPGSGNLPGLPAPQILPAPTEIKPMPTSEFDYVGFLKGPMGILMIVLIIIVALIGRK